MNYLLHSSNANYVAAQKKWEFKLDERIHRPVVLRLETAHFTCSSTQSPLPDVVYLRSDALSHLVTKKHTADLTASGHKNDTNIMAVLLETHKRGRYATTRRGDPLRCNPSHSTRTIDVYFTDGSGTILDGEYSSTSSSNIVSSGTDAEVVAIGSDLICWTDLDFTRCFDANFVATTAVGDPVNYIYDRANASVIWALGYGNNMVLANLGSTIALHRDGSWQSMADSSIPAGTMDDEFQLHFLFQQNAINDYVMLFYFPAVKILMYQGSLSFQAGNVITAIQNITIVPLQAYLVSVTRVVVNAVATFEYRVERLSNSSVQTSTSAEMGAVPTGSSTWRLGNSNTQFNQYQGPFIICNGTDPTHAATCQTWLRNTFNGEETAAPEEEETTSSEHATFFAQLKIKGNGN